MPAEATTEQEHQETVAVELLADRPAGHTAFAAATSPHGPAAKETAEDGAANRAAGSVARPEDIHVRFDRLEGQLTSLERMIGELLNLHHQAATTSASPLAPQILGVGQADVQALSAALPATPESVPPVPAPSPPVESEATPPAAEPDASQVPVWAQRTDDEELDQSVREYIARLLKPVCSPAEEPVPAATGDLTEPQNIAQDTWATAEDSRSAPPKGDVPEAADADTAEDPPAIAPSPSALAPLSLPPEHESSLDAMREVAKLSATAAIRTFEKQEAARKTFDRLPLLLVGLICGLMLLYSAVASGKSGMFVGAGAAFLAAALTAWQLLVIGRRWLWASQPVELERRRGARA